jgi:cardiolipin synthase
MRKTNNKYRLFSDPFQYYQSMLEDIEQAQAYVYLETFRLGHDVMGERFRDTLTKVAGRGVTVKLLIDYWGAGSTRSGFFDKLIHAGGEVRFFKKIKYNFDFFTRSHRRNHRKLLVIDDCLVYIGSSNITGYNLNWRESVLRMEDNIAELFKKLFLQDYKIYNRYYFSRAYFTLPKRKDGFEVVRDVPMMAKKKINDRLIQLIKGATASVWIETPYFLPGFMLRKALMDAAQRGVDVVVIMPRKSDVNLVDILRNKYLGPLHKKGIRFLFYEPNNLHAKLILIDRRLFGIGSANFDYRSFRYMFEIMLFGSEYHISRQIEAHISKTMNASIPFIYSTWENRPPIEKFFEWLLLPFRHLL